MGREVRRVTPDWDHPRDKDGHFIPLLDRDYKDDADEWLADCIAWASKSSDDASENAEDYSYYWDWNGMPPDRERYRPTWTSTPTAYQVYEDVSEGTPISPVLLTREAVVDWLVNVGSGMGLGGGELRLSREAAERFVESGGVPSMMMVGGKIFSGAAMLESVLRTS